MIDSTFGNPELMVETTKFLLEKYKLSNKTIFNGNVPQHFLNYQKYNTKEFEDIIRFYYKEILQRPIGQDKYIYICNGSLGAYNALIWSFQKLMNKNVHDPLKVYQINKPPTYGIFKNVVEYVPNCIFDINRSNHYNNIENFYANNDYYNPCDIGVMISPNNPTGEIIKERKGHFQIIDSVYDIPPFTNSYQKVNKKLSKNEIHIDSISKLGVPSYRCGWCIIEDPMLMSTLWKYKELYNNGLNSSSLFMMDSYVNHFYKYNFFNDFKTICYNNIQNRKKILTNIFSKYGIQEYNPNNKYVPYFFVPISTERFQKIGINTRKGSDFFFSDNYSRFNLMLYTSEFNKIVNILNTKLHLII